MGVKINRDGEVCIEASNERSQEMNKRAALARLNVRVCEALRPREERKVTKVPRVQKEKRREEKRRQSEKKAVRQKIKW